jgi:hypothetical protein
LRSTGAGARTIRSVNQFLSRIVPLVEPGIIAVERLRGQTMRQSVRSWATLLLVGLQAFCPAITVAMWLIIETPEYEAIDWQGETLPVRALDALLMIQLFSLPCLIAVTKRRLLAVVIGVPLLVTSGVLNFLAWFAVSGVYF